MMLEQRCFADRPPRSADIERSILSMLILSGLEAGSAPHCHLDLHDNKRSPTVRRFVPGIHILAEVHYVLNAIQQRNGTPRSS